MESVICYQGYDEESDAFIYNVSLRYSTGEKMDNDDTNDINPGDFDMQDYVQTMAKLGLSMFRAVIRDGGSWNEAFAVTGAFFAGSLKANMEDTSD